MPLVYLKRSETCVANFLIRLFIEDANHYNSRTIHSAFNMLWIISQGNTAHCRAAFGNKTSSLNIQILNQYHRVTGK